MRFALRATASLLLAVAIAWIGFEVWLFAGAGIGSGGTVANLALLLANVLLNAWPALVLIALAVGLAWFYRRYSRQTGES